MTAASPLRDRAETLVEQANADPAAVVAEGEALLGTESLDAATRSVILRATGLARRVLGDIPGSIADLDRSIAAAGEAGDSRLHGLAQTTLSASLVYAGRTDDALAAADAAAAVLYGVDLGRLDFQRSGILQRLGRTAEALAGYARAEKVLAAADDALWLARLYANRGLIHAYSGDVVEAERDTIRARDLYDRVGQEAYVAAMTHNLGFVATRAGDIPLALRRFDAADVVFRRLGLPTAPPALDRCEALLAAGLVGDAQALAGRAVADFATAGMEADRAEALLVVAHAAYLAGDFDASRNAAAEAIAALIDQARPGWLANARYAHLRTRWALGSCGPGDVARAGELADELSLAAQRYASLHCRLIAGRLALEHEDLEAAEHHLGLAARARRAGPAELRLQAWLATAALRRARGDERGAEVAARTGLRVFAEYQASLGASDARASVGLLAEALAGFGLGAAVASGKYQRAFAWMERTRAGALRLRPVRPPDDEAMAADLNDLRTVNQDLRSAELEGRSTGALQRKQFILQRSIRRRALRSAGGQGSAQRVVGLPEVRARLEGAVLVEIAEVDGNLVAAVIRPRRGDLVDLGPAAAIYPDLDAMRMALVRLGRAGASRASRDAAVTLVDRAAARLDARLLVPLGLEDQPLIVSPPATLHTVPWAALPSCRQRAVTVTPSAAHLLGGDTEVAAGHVVLAAGPGLPHARAEIEALRAVYDQAVRFSPEAATAASVTAAMDGAALAHIACHGNFRSDNPLFSSLELADGPLTVYDLERLDRAPQTVVLSACDSALSEPRPGDEIMGIAAALFSLGTRSLIATVVPVPDAPATRRLMEALHRRLVAGSGPAAALAGARGEVGDDSPAAAVASAGFVCLGAG